MQTIYLEWADLKADIIAKGFMVNYQKVGEYYDVFVADRGMFLWTSQLRNSTDITDFETNYKASCNKCIYDYEGKEFNRAESRPLTCTTMFTTVGDIVGASPAIGAGPRMAWDASVSEGWVDDENGAPTGMKQFSVTIQFCDSVWIKEGTVYYMNCMKNSLADMEVLCPNGGYYMYQGQLYQNTTGVDLTVDHYLMKHPMQDCVPMGDELNTETCSQELPSYLKYRFTATVPEADVTSYGYLELELYRARTVVIPEE